MPEPPHPPRAAAVDPGWKLGEARARFSEVVRLAAAGQPQRVTVRGRTAVVVVAAEEFDRLRVRDTAPSLHHLLSKSPLARLDFGGESVRAPVREVDISPSGQRPPYPAPPAPGTG